MRKFFDINVPFNRLQFNISVIVSFVLLGIIISCSYLSFMIAGKYEGLFAPLSFVLMLITFLVFMSSLYRRLKNLNKTNLFIINSLSLCNLLYLSAYLCIMFVCACECIKNIILGYCCLSLSALGSIILLYLLILAIFARGAGTENYVYTKPKLHNLFTNKFWLNCKDFKGKASRSEFFISGFLHVILFPLLFHKAFWLYFKFKDYSGCDSYIYYVYCIIIFYFLFWLLTLSVFIRRLRDIGLKPWHYIILILPPLNIFLMFLLLFLKGEKTKELK